jgi:hypothetical protein
MIPLQIAEGEHVGLEYFVRNIYIGRKKTAQVAVIAAVLLRYLYRHTGCTYQTK